ncbi:MAG: hypothetical protein R3281_14365 [Balneolaceae bacterium]|nr:hypothetical protein [Balneolaceae bacterium]
MVFLRNYNTWLFSGQGWNYGGYRFRNYLKFGWYISFSNLWSLNTNMNYFGREYDDRVTRGGPIVLRTRGWNTSSMLRGDPSNWISWDFGFYIKRDEEGGHRFDVRGGLSLRPASHIQLSIRPQYDHRVITDQ